MKTESQVYPLRIYRFLVVIALLFAAQISAAQVPAILHADLSEIRRLASLSGHVLPSASAPYTGAEFLSTLQQVLPDASDASREAIEILIDDLTDLNKQLMNITLDLDYERYFRPSHPLDLREMLESTDPFGSITLAYQSELSIVLFMRLILQGEYQYNDPVDNWFQSMPGNPLSLENNNVREGYFALHQPAFDLIIGRQDVQIGPSPLSSLIITRNVPFLDAFTMRTHLGALGMTMIVSTLENRQAAGDVALPPIGPYGFGRTVILNNVHYFEYDLEFLRIGIGGQILATREDNAFQAGDFFPVFSWHQANITPNNLTLTIDASVVPFPGFEAYVQLGFDDINASIFATSDGGIPTIPAALVGAAWYAIFGGFTLDLGLEVGFTHYLWGSYDDDTPLARAIYRMDLDSTDQWLPLNSPYGPGTAWLLLNTRLETPWKISAYYSAELLLRKPGVNLATTSYQPDPVLEAQPMVPSFRTGLEVTFAPWRWLSLSLKPELFIDNEKSWMELTIGVGSHL